SVDGAVISEISTTVVPAYSTAIYTFNTGVDLSAFKQYNIKVWVEITGDSDNSNDTAQKTVTNLNCAVTYPYVQDFENDILLRDCWGLEASNTSTNNTVWNGAQGWGVFADRFKSGSNAFRFSSATLSDSYQQYLISPELSATSAVRLLRFYYQKTVTASERIVVGFSETTDDITAFTWKDTIYPPERNIWYEYLNYAVQQGVKYIAIQYTPEGNRSYLYIDFLSMEEIPAQDAAMEGIISPAVLGVDLTSSEDITVRIKNSGSNTLQPFTLSYAINNGTVVSETVSDTAIPSNAEYVYTFNTKADLSASGSYSVKAWITQAGDNININDTFTKEVNIVVCKVSFPYVQDFESELEVDNCLTAIAPNSANTMGVIDYSGFSGQNFYRFSAYNSTGGGYEQILVFQEFPTDKIKDISFYYRHQTNLEAGTGNFSTGYSTKTSSVSDFTWDDEVTQINIDWTRYSKENIPYNAKYIAIRFNPTVNGNRFWIDNVVIDGRNAVQKDLAVQDITYPLSNNSNLSASEYVTVTLKNFSNVEAVTAGSYKMYISVDNTVAAVEDGSLDLLSGEAATYTFATGIDLSEFTSYDIKVWAEIAGDEEPTNDTATKTVQNIDCIMSSFPYLFDFQALGVNFLDCWRLVMDEPNNANGASTGVYNDGGNYFWRFSSYSAPTGSENYFMSLISPTLASTAEDKIISFNYATSVQGYLDEEKFAAGYIAMGGEYVWLDTVSATNDDWLTYTNSIPGNAKNAVIRYLSEDEAYLYIDSIAIDVAVVVPVRDLRITAIDALPADIVLTEGEVVDIPVTISVRNDGDILLPFTAGFGYKVIRNSDDTVESVYEGCARSIAASDEFNYTFSDSISFGSAGVYTIYAWTEVENNLHNDTVRTETTVTVEALPVKDLRVTAISGLPTEIMLEAGQVFIVVPNITVRNDGDTLLPSEAGFSYRIFKNYQEINNVNEEYIYGIAAGSEFNYSFNSSVFFGDSGIYKVYAWAEVEGNLHNDTVEVEVTVTKTFNVDNEILPSTLEISVYPNPSNGHFTINAASGTTIEIINANGIVLDRKKVLGVSEFWLRTKGLYLLRFIDEKGRTSAQRLIVK
ncbi:MAG: T9SS type A sorting domain-containing protein, partial [Bacteroidales bacterium]|nr:T9SS type A sorting domain-containing protein [Bacteroidales bacterium]